MTVYCNETGCFQNRMGGSSYCPEHHNENMKGVTSCVRKCGRFAPNGETLCGICKRGSELDLQPHRAPTTGIFPPSAAFHSSHLVREQHGEEACWTCGSSDRATLMAECKARKIRDITKEGPETKETLGGGATRTKAKYRFELMPECALRRLALRFTGGAAKHGENNWKKGDFMFVVSCFGHAAAHLSAMKREGNTHDDNIGAALWNLSAIAWYEEFKPEEVAKALNYMERGDQ